MRSRSTALLSGLRGAGLPRKLGGLLIGLPATAMLLGNSGCEEETVTIGGGKYSGMLLKDGIVWGWGGNGGDVTTGQLGDGTDDDHTIPVQALIQDVQALAVGR